VSQWVSANAVFDISVSSEDIFNVCNVHKIFDIVDLRLKHVIYSRSNFTLEQAMKAQRGSRDIAVLFFQPRR
jgi:hypothetical protein